MSAGLVIPHAYRSRAWFEQRIKTLNNKHCTTAAQVQASFTELVQLSVDMAREVTAVALVQAFASLVEETPVATGRARAGWQIVTAREEREFTPGPTEMEIGAAIRRAVPQVQELTKADILWVVNNVEYILALNAGWSKKLPGGFIDRFLLTLRDTLAEAAQQMSKAR